MYLEGEEIDAVTLYAKMAKDQSLKKAGGAPYLAELLQSFKFDANVGAYAQIVIDHWKLRKVHELGSAFSTIQADPDDIAPALEEARQFLDDVDDLAAEDTAHGLADLYMQFTERQEENIPAIETPFLQINDTIKGGYRRKRMYVIGARPGCGKTVFLTQCGLYAALSGYKTLFFSLELSKEDLMERVLACGAHADYGQIASGRMKPETMSAVSQWIGAAASLPFHVDDAEDLTIEEISQRARIHKQRHGLDVVAIDYLQYIETSKGDNREQQINHIARVARSIAKRLDVVVLIAAQLNRKIEGDGGKPRLPLKSDFRESGGIEQTADVAMILHRPPDENGEETGMPRMNITTVKNRQGLEKTMRLAERFDQSRFENLSG